MNGGGGNLFALKGQAVGIVGRVGTHQDQLERWMTRFAERGIRSVVQLGNWQMGWAESAAKPAFVDLDETLRRNGQTLFMVDGSHDDLRLLHLPLDREGTAPLAARIRYLGRGCRGVFDSGAQWAAMGGGATIGVAPDGRFDVQVTDRARRSPDEVISPADVAALGDAQVSVLFAHDAPSGVPALREFFRTALHSKLFTFEERLYDLKARGAFTKAFHLVRPTIHFGAHFPMYTNQVVGFDDGQGLGYACRIVLLDSVTTSLPCAAILDVDTLGVTVLNHEGEEVQSEPQVLDLTTQTAGQWQVHTRDSTHIFDLDRRRWLRIPGPHALDWHRATQPLRSITACKVGERGHWTMRSEEFLIEYYWCDSSVIRYIEPFDGEWPGMDA
ncbi:hypothetical protein [Agromyces sp. NPDC058104]|uniref:hypothetical protein n=1 Tax=Agromyces sp. NPDC058104 TaxID=3346342 RepID=UPI0036D77EA4